MFRKLFAVLSLLFIASCSNVPNEAAYQPSPTSLPIGQQSFDEYAQSTRQWLAQNRLFVSKTPEAELKANTPFEVLPKIELAQSRGILLVHGLSDSPYSFVDIAPMLAEMGFQVRTILLEGHGSKPADLLDADSDNWQALLEQQVTIFKQEVDLLYLGGFSTGGNLVTSYALQDDEIQGLMLFSPGYKTSSDMARYAPLVSVFKDWLYTPSMKNETNYVRYLVAPSNAFAQFYHTSADILQRLEHREYTKPVFIAVSQTDSVLDVNKTLQLFSARMTNPKNRLIWYGNKPQSSDDRVRVFSGHVPDLKVSNFSHMGLLFNSNNPYYGSEGSQRICNNGQSNKAYWQCQKREEVWYSAWGYREADKAHARLTFNPWFDEMVATIREVFVAD